MSGGADELWLGVVRERYPGSLGGIETDIGLAMFSIVGVAGLLLAGAAITNHAQPKLISPA